MSRHIRITSTSGGDLFSREIDLAHPNARAALVLYGLRENLIDLLLSDTFISVESPGDPQQLEIRFE